VDDDPRRYEHLGTIRLEDPEAVAWAAKARRGHPGPAGVTLTRDRALPDEAAVATVACMVRSKASVEHGTWQRRHDEFRRGYETNLRFRCHRSPSSSTAAVQSSKLSPSTSSTKCWTS
jgi:hypothetical protein